MFGLFKKKKEKYSKEEKECIKLFEKIKQEYDFKIDDNNIRFAFEVSGKALYFNFVFICGKQFNGDSFHFNDDLTTEEIYKVICLVAMEHDKQIEIEKRIISKLKESIKNI